MSLDVTHWQLFAKRLRKRLGRFRFFHAGEYGERTRRPHYHALIFGIGFGDRRFYKSVRGARLDTSETLDEVWGKGQCVIGEVTFESAAYVARYVTKKVTGDLAEAHYGGRKPEYATMSRRPGIGAEWIERYYDEIYPRDEVIARGRECKPPRYYDQVAARRDPEMFEGIKADRVDRAEADPDNERGRLLVREKCKEAAVSLFAREPGRETI